LISLLAFVAVVPIQADNDDLGEIRELAASGRTYEALTRLEPLLTAEPDRVEALLLRGILLTQLGRVDEAKTIFLDLIESSPELPEPYINLAALYAGAGDYDRAVEVLKEALATHPSYLAAYENLTKVYGKLASEAYRRALGNEVETVDEAVDLALLDRIHGPVMPETGESTVVEAERAQTAGSLALRLPAADPEPPAALAEPEVPVTAPVETPGNASSPPAGPEAQQIAEMVAGWARAWTEQTVEEYLHFYSAQFTPMNGLSREGWEVMRRGRLTGPGFISISVQDLEVEKKAPGSAEARFVQLYESNVLQDTCVKVLSLIWEEGEWKIAAERIEE
jgi:tetratricopeptide (TPR) repeat protein